MANCKHDHGHLQADAWTKFSATGEGVASFISDAYWLGGLFDLATQLDDAGMGLSWYGLGFGSAISLLLTVGSVYSHSVLNINHQEKPVDKQDDEIDVEEGLEHSHAHSHSHSHSHSHECDHDNPAFVSHESEDAEDGELEHDDSHSEKEVFIEKKPVRATGLSTLQHLSLLADFTSHAGDIAGPITFVTNIATKGALPIWGKALVQCGATVFGGLASVANVRTCRNSMIQRNAEKAAEASVAESSTIMHRG